MSGNGPTLLAAPDPATVKWVPLGGGQSGSMIALQEVTPVGGVLDFQNIPQDYSSLIIDVIARDNVATGVTAIGMRLNNVSTSVYYAETLNATGTSVSAGETGAQGSARVGIAIASQADAADMVGFTRIVIPWYARSDFRKVWRSLGGEGYGVAAGKLATRDRSGWVDSSVAISRITLGSYESGGTLIAPSRAILYGLAAPGASLSLGGGSADLVYNGEYPAATPYTDGDIVIYQGQAYLCVRPTSAAPTPWTLSGKEKAGCKLWNSTALTVGASATVYLAWDSEEYDDDTMHDGAAPSRITIKTAGRYLFVFHAALTSVAGAGYFRIRKNGSLMLGQQASPGSGEAGVVTAIDDMIVGDYVEAQVQNTAGATYSLTTPATTFAAQKVA